MYTKKTLIINIFGAPSSGKSTTAAGIFYHMKMAGINCELSTEVAKDLTWEKRFRTLENQAYIFAKQMQKLHRIMDQVDAVITDSPLPLSSIYAPNNYPNSFHLFVSDVFQSMNNLNFLIRRVTPYQSSGRKETESQSNLVGEQIKNYLTTNSILFHELDGNPQAIQSIFDVVKTRLNKQNPS